MMKDQFANYVVQKVLETCDDQQREMILTRIKAHLNTLKKYTYGKHIVARVEKLVAAGGTVYLLCSHANLSVPRYTPIKPVLMLMTPICRCSRRKAPGASTGMHCRLKGEHCSCTANSG